MFRNFFVALSVCLTAMLSAGPEPAAESTSPWKKGSVPETVKRTGKSYRIILLGDTHFDAEKNVYHAEYKNPTPNRRREFARNAAMWQERMPRLLKAAAKQKTPDTPAVIHVGDLVQGDCGNPETHSKMLLDALSIMKKEFGSSLFLATTGNHDVRGTNAGKACRKTMCAHHSDELKKKITSTTFYTMIGGDLYLFVDFNSPDLKTITGAMNEKARYKFVICHGPVLPSDSRSFRWFLLGAKKKDSLRHKVQTLFMKNDVIVLTGHFHDLELTECVTTEGRITQLMANSVWQDESLADFKTVFSKPSEYGKNRTEPDAQKLFGEYKDVITRYWKASGAGYCVIDISPEGITAKLFGGDSLKPSKEIRLR